MFQKRSLSFFNRKKEVLIPKPAPNQDLAMKIIEKEIELEKTWDVTVIHELMTLYSKIIEQYEQNNNPKFSDFQDRMHKMLMKPEVTSALQKANCPKVTKTDAKMPRSPRSHPVLPKATNPANDSSSLSLNPTPTNSNQEAKPRLSIDKILLNPSKAANSLTARKAQLEATRKMLTKELNTNLEKPKIVRKVNCIIERQSSTSRETAHRAVADFKSQESGLERRKASRKLSAMARSMTMNTSTSSCFSRAQLDTSEISEDTSAGSKHAAGIEELSKAEELNYEKRLEEIMEKNYTERAMRIAEIKVKYENQMEEMGGNGQIMEMVLRQMKVNMLEEIGRVTSEFDLKRKEEIRRLKEVSGC